jgi:hypothetical protein
MDFNFKDRWLRLLLSEAINSLLLLALIIMENIIAANGEKLETKKQR